MATIAAWAMVALSAIVLAGWASNQRVLEFFLPASLSMKANAAVCALLAGVTLLRRDHRDRFVYAILALLIAGLTLAQYYWIPDLGIDQFLFRDTHYIAFPGRMSQYTSEAYMLLAVSLLLMRSRRSLARELSRVFAVAAGIWGAIVLVTYAFNVPSPLMIGPHRNVAFPSAISFVLCATGVLYTNPGEGFVRLLHASNPGGAALRRLLPASIAATLLLGFAVINLQKHYQWEFGFTTAVVGGVVTLCLITVLGLTALDLEREDRAVRESERRFRLAANSAPVMIWASGTDKLCGYFNERWLNFTGRTLEQETGNGWAAGVHPDDLEGCISTYVDHFDRRQTFRMQYRLRRHDGVYRWIIDIGVPRFVDGVFAGYIGSCVDITDHKLAEEAIGDLHRKVFEAQEEERSRIARELHDDINQRIAMLTWQLSSAGQKGKSSESTMRSSVVTAVDQLRQLANDIQAISRRLHSSHLEYLGLATAGAALCRETAEQQEVEIDFHCDLTLPRLPKDVSLSLYRVLQEALQNAIKHSGGRSFRVELMEGPGEVRLNVIDHGSGFDPYGLNGYHGLGLISMRERMRLVRGEFAVDSQPGKGTTIRCRVPLPEEDSAREAQHEQETV